MLLMADSSFRAWWMRMYILKVPCCRLLNLPVEHYQIDLGLVQTGDPADFIIVDDLKNFNVLQSFSRGICVFDGVGEAPCFSSAYPHLSMSASVYPNNFSAGFRRRCGSCLRKTQQSGFTYGQRPDLAVYDTFVYGFAGYSGNKTWR